MSTMATWRDSQSRGVIWRCTAWWQPCGGKQFFRQTFWVVKCNFSTFTKFLPHSVYLSAVNSTWWRWNAGLCSVSSSTVRVPFTSTTNLVTALSLVSSLGCWVTLSSQVLPGDFPRCSKLTNSVGQVQWRYLSYNYFFLKITYHMWLSSLRYFYVHYKTFMK
jgi:hypothetical protein